MTDKTIANSPVAFTKYKWRMLLAAMLCYFFFYTGRQTMGFAIPGLQAEFGFTKETLGWISAAMLWAYAIGHFINGNIVDKYGGRRIMSLGAILSCFANWATSFGTGFISIIIPWGINGYFQSMGWSSGGKLLSNWWTRSERGKVFGLYTFAAGCASVLSYVTSLIVVDTLHLDWQWIFRLPVILMLVGGVIFYFSTRERPSELGFDDIEDTGVSHAHDTNHASDGEETSFSRYIAVLKNWRLMIACVAIGFQNAARYGLLVWVPVHFLGADWSHAENAIIDPRWISIMLPIGMALGALSNGWISDTLFGSKRYLAISSYMLLAAVASFSMYYIEGQFMVSIIALFLAGFFVYGPQSSFWALCPDLVGAKRAGTATGVMDFFAYVFAGLGEPLIGHIMDRSGDTSQVFMVVTISCLASGIVAFFIKR